MLQQLLPAFRMTLFVTILTGFLYPGLLTAICEVVFPRQATGSLVERNGVVVGSLLLGQNFAKPGYFHPRPSAAGNNGYDASASGASNLGPTNRALVDRVKGGVEQFRQQNPSFAGPVPADAVTASGSGLDPEISPANAAAQVARVAAARQISQAQVMKLVAQATHGRDWGFLGEPRVNVLDLNMRLDHEAR